MAWYYDLANTQAYKRRKAFSVVTTATASSVDVELTIPTGYDDFWGAIDANGYGVRFFAADGVTAINHQIQSFSSTTRTAIFELESAPLPSAVDRCVLYWMVFAPIGTAVNLGHTFTVSSPATASMELGQPDPASAIPVRPQTPSEAQPAGRIAKGTAEVRDVFFDLTDALQPAAGLYNGHRQWEEPGIAQVDVYNSAGTSQASMNEPSAMRWVSVDVGGGSQRQRLYLRARVKAGTDSTSYTLAADIDTITPLSTPNYRNLPARLGVQVKNQLEA
ncbi:MAG: hypothetical protein ACPGVG_19945 [Mycobacterium sp.]